MIFLAVFMGKKLMASLDTAFLAGILLKIDFDSLLLKYIIRAVSGIHRWFFAASFIYSFAHTAINNKRCKDRYRQIFILIQARDFVF